MGRAKAHFIPCLLLAQFSVDGSTGRKARVFQLRKSGPHPSKPVSAEDLAHAGDFYAHSDSPNLDEAGLLSEERRAATLLHDLSAGADPQGRVEEVLSLVSLQAVRTKAFRTEGAGKSKLLLDKALDALGKPASAQLIRTELMRQLDQEGESTLVRLGIPEPLARLLVAKLGRDGLKKFVEAQLSDESTATFLAQLQGQLSTESIAIDGITKAQIKGLHANVGSSNEQHAFRSARWVRLESQGVPLVLGDACVVCVGSDGSLGWTFKFGKRWAEVYMPINKELAIVGLAPDGPAQPTLTASQLNEASARLSCEYIYASRCSKLELEQASMIGSVEPLIDSEAIGDLVDEGLADGIRGL